MIKKGFVIGIIILLIGISINPAVAVLNSDEVTTLQNTNHILFRDKDSNDETKPQNTNNIHFRVKGLISNPIITDEYVEFFALIVIVTAIWEFDAETYEYEYFTQPYTKSTITSGIHILKRLILPNNYTGTISNTYINAIFEIPIVEDYEPSVIARGTPQQILLILEKAGSDYDGGYTISTGSDNEVTVFINGSKATLIPGLWEVGKPIYLGLNAGTWTEGYMCPEDDYDVTVSIKNTVVFDGKVYVGDFGGDENASVKARGTPSQILLILETPGKNYDYGYTISAGVDNEVTVFINGSKAILTPGLWEVGGQIFLGLNGGVWTQGTYTCPLDYYDVTVSIKNTLVYYGTVIVGDFGGDENASVVASGTTDQILLILEKPGWKYDGGYTISHGVDNEVTVFINGSKAVLKPGVWEVGGQIYLGLNGATWTQGTYTCPDDDYDVAVSIRNTLVYYGTVTVG